MSKKWIYSWIESAMNCLTDERDSSSDCSNDYNLDQSIINTNQMIKERTVKQHKGELQRRLFNNAYFDIFVWHDEFDSIVKFQLCYDIYCNERALTWTEGKGFKHDIIDDGGIDPTRNESPVLKEGGVFPLEDILEKFVVSSEGIDPLVRTFIIDTLNTYRKYH